MSAKPQEITDGSNRPVADSVDFEDRLNSPEFDQNPYPLYHELRVQAPVYWSESWRCWILTRYDDIQATLRDYRRFSSLERWTSAIRPDLSAPFWEQIQPLVGHYNSGLVNIDPPDHTRLRTLMQQAFTPRTVQRLADSIGQIVDELLERALGNDRVELVGDLAYPLPVTVIAELLGVPIDDRQQLREWSSATLEFMTTPRPSRAALLRSQEAMLALRELFRNLYVERRQQPDDRLVSALLAAEEEGDKLSEEELLSTCVTLLVAGHETTTSLISSTIYLLLKHPDQLQKLRETPSVIESAVEESLRYEGSFQRSRRIATEDVILCGQQIRKGQLVLQFLGAANRDPAHFSDPDRFDIQRQPNRHLSFGFGVHICLGAALARLETKIAVSTILRRMPDLQLATDTVEWENTLLRGLKALPLSCSDVIAG